MTDAQTVEPSSIFIKTLPVGPLSCNCTIIGNTETGDAIVIDPGGDADTLLKLLAEQNLSVRQILHTHAHFDHFLASGEMKRQTGATLALHREDKPLWEKLDVQCGYFGFEYDKTMPPPDHWLEHDEPIETVSGLSGQCLHTPGHTPGSMCFHFDTLNLLLGGDTLFRGSIGRTDLWGGDFNTIQRSIQQHLFSLDEATQVIAGHGRSTTIGYELEHNPYVSR